MRDHHGFPREEQRSGRHPRPRPKHGACPGLLARPAPPVNFVRAAGRRRATSAKRTHTDQTGSAPSPASDRRATLDQANGEPKNSTGSRNHYANLRRRTVRIGTSGPSVRNVIARVAAVAGTCPVTDAESMEGMTTEAHLWNAPRPPERQPRPGQRIWSLWKQARRIDCELRTFESAAEVQLFVNDEFYSGRTHVSLEFAAHAAESIRARLIHAGWTAW